MTTRSNSTLLSGRSTFAVLASGVIHGALTWAVTGLAASAPPPGSRSRADRSRADRSRARLSRARGDGLRAFLRADPDLGSAAGRHRRPGPRRRALRGLSPHLGGD